ncbi:MAG: hypothetical protein JSV56_09120 [Methanomassiliicoccales archaeon]|nr:MAG: hypothetical protein JSV56_09120 [Methanomassiliicoccales archaeon]
MPHQCLKCGSVFADGSPQILRGCPECGGTKFFFTEKTMSDEERKKLKEKANTDIKHLIQEMMTNDTVPIKINKESFEKDEWVYLGGTGQTESEEEDEVSQKEVEKKILKSIEDLKFPKEGRLKKLKFVSKGEAKKVAKKVASAEKVKSKETTKKVPAKKPKKEERVAVITITDEGVYDIDVEKLLEHSPIIVQKDGSYMVHLPSVFKRSRKKGSAV